VCRVSSFPKVPATITFGVSSFTCRRSVSWWIGDGGGLTIKQSRKNFHASFLLIISRKTEVREHLMVVNDTKGTGTSTSSSYCTWSAGTRRWTVPIRTMILIRVKPAFLLSFQYPTTPPLRRLPGGVAVQPPISVHHIFGAHILPVRFRVLTQSTVIHHWQWHIDVMCLMSAEKLWVA